MKHFLIVLILLFSKISFGQTYLLKTEEIILSFETKNGKKAVLAKDTMNLYIVYRYGTTNKVEFEFPDKSKESWLRFKYSFYLRGGGTSNDGMDLNYIHFTNKNFNFTIYDTYNAIDMKSNVGIKVTNLTTNKTTDIKGIYKSKKGTLVDFRDNNFQLS
jgi:hypothetical protein